MNLMIAFRAGLKMLLHKDKLVAFDFLQVVRHDIIKNTFTGEFEDEQSFVVYEYAPYVFDQVRRLIGISREEYQRSIGPENMLGNLLLGYLDSMRELASEGQSGSLFYLTPDGRFFVKTIKEGEFEQMRTTLRSYYEYLDRNPSSLIFRVTGLYSMRGMIGGKFRTKYLIIMQNVFSEFRPAISYDLKGSTYNRTSYTRTGELKSKVLKDLDWMRDGRKIKMEDEAARTSLLATIKSDCIFLASLRSIDYSLIVGITPDAEKGDQYCLAIIDTLTHFGGMKRLEYFFKRVFLGKGASCVPPNQYAKRFYRFLHSQIV